MGILPLVCLVIAGVLFALGAFGVPVPPRFSLISGGLFFWVLAVVLREWVP